MEWLQQNLGPDTSSLPLWLRLCIIAAIFVVAFLVDVIFKKCIIPLVQQMTKRTDTEWDDILLSPRVLESASHILPPVILAAALPFALQGTLEVIVARLTYAYIIYKVSYFITVVMHAVFCIFTHEKQAKASSLKGILQTLQIMVWLVAAIIIISVLIARSPLYLITGLGAAATVLMLVFQDSIKGLVAGVQLSMNDMVRVGDWIMLPSRGADGVVTEITLSTVKMRCWDNTILTLQPYTLLTDTVLNWRGMQQSDGRRLTRSVNVNMLSVHALDAAQVADYQRQGWLNAQAQAGVATNLEALRGYMEQQLRQMPDINSQMTLMVRQLPASSEGIPLQVYAFSRTKEWKEYEDVQSRVIEFLLASMPQFGILPFQRSCDAPQNYK